MGEGEGEGEREREPKGAKGNSSSVTRAHVAHTGTRCARVPRKHSLPQMLSAAPRDGARAL